MFNKKNMFLKKQGTGTVLDYLPEECRLRRTWMDHSSGHRDHYISNPAWRDGYGSLDGAKVISAHSNRPGYGNTSTISISKDIGVTNLYVYFLEAQRYLRFEGSGTLFTCVPGTATPALFYIYEYEYNGNLSKVPSSDGYPTLFISKEPFKHIGNPIESSTAFAEYANNFRWIDWSQIDPTWDLG